MILIDNNTMRGKRFVILSAFAASLGGLLFGFDAAVISGAEKTIQQWFNLSGFWHGALTPSFLPVWHPCIKIK
jgi:hypothetical protein